jgi:hypothetical protein
VSVVRNALLSWLFAWSLTGCVTDEIVVATLEAGAPSDHHVRADDHPCDDNVDCAANELCEKMRCDDRTGHCVLRPFSCPPDTDPSCGCDGITYWNNCLRRQNGVSGAGPGECAESAFTCTSSDAHECPMPGSSCARLLPPGLMCTTDVRGSCWMLPDVCPPHPPFESWTSCANPTVCEDTCSAIRSGVVHQRNPMRGCEERDH